MVTLPGLAVPLQAATKTVDVGPDGALIFQDEESGTSTTTITAGDTVEWVWRSSGHSSTRTDSPETWDSGIQDAPFSFSRTFTVPGRYAYHCTPHEFLGMVGTVLVQPVAGATTSTTVPPQPACTDAAAVAVVRAQVESQCPCAGAARHGAYVRCAIAVARAAVAAGRLPMVCTAAVKQCAAKSTCGRPRFVTCCRTTPQGNQMCRIRRRVGACKPPSGGAACVGDRPSCCDACGGATCPLPVTTTTFTSTTSSTTVAGGTSSTTTTSTAPPLPQCLVDADCAVGSVCEGVPRCVQGVCVAGSPTQCMDGTPGLWIATATGLAGSFDIAITICTFDGLVSATLFCLPGSVPCFGQAVGVTVIGVNGITLLFDPLTFADGTTCAFDGLLVGLAMGGDFLCVDPFGFAVNVGTWTATRCPIAG